MSRFLIQMKYDPVMKPEFLDLDFEIKSHSIDRERIERREEHSQQLRSRFLDKNNRTDIIAFSNKYMAELQDEVLLPLCKRIEGA